MLSKSILQLLAYFYSATVDCFYSALDNWIYIFHLHQV